MNRRQSLASFLSAILASVWPGRAKARDVEETRKFLPNHELRWTRCEICDALWGQNYESEINNFLMDAGICADCAMDGIKAAAKMARCKHPRKEWAGDVIVCLDCGLVFRASSTALSRAHGRRLEEALNRRDPIEMLEVGKPCLVRSGKVVIADEQADVAT